MTRSRQADRPRSDRRIWPRRLAAIGVTAGLLLASGCAAPAQEPEGPWHLRVGLGAAFEPTNLVPGKQGNITATLTLTDNVVETLVRNSPEGDLEGLLAESWEQGATENIWRFHLREGVLFPDGSELDAQTVSNSMDTIRDPAYSSALAPYYRGLERIDVVDTYTVDFVLTQPDSLWPALLNTFPILPNGIDVEDPTTWNGTGPYTLGKVDVNLVELEKKDDYWGGTTAGPEQVTISSVTEAASMTTGLSTGTLDVGHPISPDLVDTLPDSFVASPSQVMMIKLNALRPPFDDPLVREAVALGVDMEGNRKSLIGDEFSMDARCQWVAEGNVGFAPDVTTPEYDPERAKELIAEAGAAADAKIRLAVPAAYYLAGEEISTVVAEQMRDIGLDVELLVQDVPTWLRTIQEGAKEDRVEAFLVTASWPAGIGYQLNSQVDPAANLSLFPHDEYPDLWPLYQRAKAEFDPASQADLFAEAAEEMCSSNAQLFAYMPNKVFGLESESIQVPQRTDDRVPYAFFTRD